MELCAACDNCIKPNTSVRRVCKVGGVYSKRKFDSRMNSSRRTFNLISFMLSYLWLWDI